MKVINYLGFRGTKTSQQKIASILDVSKSTVNSYENKGEYKLSDLTKISNYYNLSLVGLLYGIKTITQDDINNNAKSSNTTSSSSTKDITTQKLAIELLKRLSNLNNELTDTFNNELNINKERVKE